MLTEFQVKVFKELIQAAKKQVVLTYGELAIRLGRRGKTLALANALGNISYYTYDKIGVFISVIVVNDKTRLPGQGFYQMASNSVTEDEDPGIFDHTEYAEKHIHCVHSISNRVWQRLLNEAIY